MQFLLVRPWSRNYMIISLTLLRIKHMDKNEIINSRHDLINMVKSNNPTLGRRE